MSTLYEVILNFFYAWFPSSVIQQYDGEFNQICMLVTCGLVLFIAYNLCIGWWWKRR